MKLSERIKAQKREEKKRVIRDLLFALFLTIILIVSLSTGKLYRVSTDKWLTNHGENLVRIEKEIKHLQESLNGMQTRIILMEGEMQALRLEVHKVRQVNKAFKEIYDLMKEELERR